MRIAILSICCLFFMLSSVKAQQAYYVSLEGHDMTGDGSFENPWRTWKKGFESVSAGDTLYIRGGEYIETDDRGGGAIRVEYLEGTKENPTCFFAYPEDYEAGNIPILDGRNSEGSSQGYNGAISFSFSKHLKFKGLTVRNFYQIDVSDRGLPQSQLAVGFNGTGNLNCHFENITVHDIGGRGIYWRNGYQGGMTIDSTYFINCDVYNCVDPYSYYTNNDQIVDNAGNGADGYFIQAYRYVYYHDDPELFRSYVLIENCRAWRCADDGFNLDGNAHMELKNCWSFNNDVYSDYPKSEGNGFKLGTVISEPADTIYRKLTNCIAANCGLGYTHNNGLDGYWPRSQMYNCASYNTASGIVIQNLAESKAEYGIYIDASWNVYKNHLSYKDFRSFNSPALQGNHDYVYTESNNTWRSKPTGSGWELNPAFDVNDDDFLSLDVSELARDRKPDGSLPDVTFLKLDSLSDLIDAGTEVGLPYFGSAPDIGPWEYGLISNPPTVRITSPPHDTSFNINDTIDILVNATDSDGSVVKVEFFVDNVKIGEDTSSPWTYSWTNATLGSYDITAVATDNDNTVAPSQTVRISVGAENVLFPNPNNGNFTILLKDPFDHLGHVNIFSRDGKLVYAESISPFDDIIEINQPNLKAGLYIIRISSDAGLLTRKFIKQ